MDSKMLRTSDPPQQRDNNLTMPTVGCVWKISGDMFVTGSLRYHIKVMKTPRETRLLVLKVKMIESEN